MTAQSRTSPPSPPPRTPARSSAAPDATESNFVTPPRTVRRHAGLNPAAEAREREADSKRRVKMARECIGGKNSFSLDQASDEDFINFKAGLRSASAIDDITFEEFHEAVMDVIVATSTATQIVRRSVLTASDIDEMVDEISSLFDPNTEVARDQRFLSSRRERNMAVQQWKKTVEREGNRLGHLHLICRRTLLTLNRLHFIRLHYACVGGHSGIVVTPEFASPHFRARP